VTKAKLIRVEMRFTPRGTNHAPSPDMFPWESYPDGWLLLCDDVPKYYDIKLGEPFWLVAGNRPPKGRDLAVYTLRADYSGVKIGRHAVLGTSTGTWLWQATQAGATHVWIETE
jgi:hypothetical protein